MYGIGPGRDLLSADPPACYKLKENSNLGWNLYDLADRLFNEGMASACLSTS